MSTNRWTEANVPDLAGKRAVVTGATSGLGRGGMRGYPVRVQPVDRARDPELARRLWEISVERTGVDF